MKLTGTVQDGLKKAQSFLKHPAYQERILSLAGFLPFPGTLNAKVNPTKWLVFRQWAAKKTQAQFAHNTRVFGGFDLYKIKLVDQSIGAVIVPHQTRHGPETIEIIAPANLKKKFGLKTKSVFSFTTEH